VDEQLDSSLITTLGVGEWSASNTPRFFRGQSDLVTNWI